MDNLALFFYSCKEDKQLNNISFRGVYGKLKRIFAFKLPPDSIRKLEVDDDSAIHLVKLPYTSEELKCAGSFTQKKVKKHVNRICVENSIDKCVVPNSFPCSIDLSTCTKNPFSGDLVYAALVLNILENICARKDTSIRGMDIAIIQGDNSTLPYIFVRLLSPMVKYITLVTNNRESAEKRIEEVCDETGLSVRLTNDAASVLTSADIVINYGNLKSYGIKKRIASKAIVINYGELEENLFRSSEVINGIEIGFGNKYKESFKDEIFSCYSHTEIAEIILLRKLGITVNNLSNFADYNIVCGLIKHFKEEGFYIKEYVAR